MIAAINARICFSTLGLSGQEVFEKLEASLDKGRAEQVVEYHDNDDDVLATATEVRNNNTVIDNTDLTVLFLGKNNLIRSYLYMPVDSGRDQRRDYVYCDLIKNELIISMSINICHRYIKDDKLFGIELSKLREVKENTTLIVNGLDMSPNPTSEYVTVGECGLPRDNRRIIRGLLETEEEFILRIIADKKTCKDLIAAYVDVRKQAISTTDGIDARFVPPNKRGLTSRGAFGQWSGAKEQTHLFISGESIPVKTLEKVFQGVTKDFLKYIEDLFRKIEQFAKDMEKIEIDEIEAHREFYKNLDLK